MEHAHTAGHLAVGSAGEDIAEWYLREKKYVILGKNIRAWRGEIDLVANKGGTVVFVEVKTRARADAWQPSERVDGKKIGRLKRAATSWLEEHGLGDIPARIDVVGVCGGKVVEHLEDVTA